MQASTAAGGLIARAANRHLGKSDREAAGVLSARSAAHFLDSPRMVAVLGRSDFGFADLKRRNVSVFLVLPPDRLATYSAGCACSSRKASPTWPAIPPSRPCRSSSAG